MSALGRYELCDRGMLGEQGHLLPWFSNKNKPHQYLKK
jgi:hypothetical protein